MWRGRFFLLSRSQSCRTTAQACGGPLRAWTPLRNDDSNSESSGVQKHGRGRRSPNPRRESLFFLEEVVTPVRAIAGIQAARLSHVTSRSEERRVGKEC